MSDPGAGNATALIEFDSVSKWFGPVVAVSDVTFTVGPGITALLGPNGAGKSTVMRLLCGLTAPSRGTIRVLGSRPRGNPELYRRIGLVPQQESVLEPLTASEFVELTARLSDVAGPSAAAAAALDAVEMDPADRRPLKTYSKGMRQRVKVAAALVHQPDLLVLDEPLNGLDPRQRLRMIELFRELAGDGKCVLVSSHVLEEVERFGSQILVIAEGRLAASGDFVAIRELMDDRPHRVRVRCSEGRALGAALLAVDGVVGVRLQPDGALVVDTDDASQFRRAVLGEARRGGHHLLEVTPLDDDLESVFRYLVGRRG